MAWVDAVKKYAEMKGKKFQIYKRGTPEHAEIKALQAKGTGGLTKAKAKKLAAEMMGKPKRSRKPKAAAVAAMAAPVAAVAAGGRKVRKDKGMKRVTDLQVAKESVKQGLVSRSVALGRKPRSDKGKKRGARKEKELPGTSELQFDRIYDD